MAAREAPEVPAQGALRLRLGEPSIVARVAAGRVLLDPRTLPEDAAPDIGRALVQALLA